MSASRPFATRAWIWIEFIAAATILVALYKVAAFYSSAGYLPPPFFDQSFDTFMDWYNTVYWGFRPGTYEEWYSVYPPFAFLFMDLFSIPSCYYDSAIIARECDPGGAWFITACTLLNATLVYLTFRRIDAITAWPRAIALGIGMPALFAWERGNVIVPCFTFFILAHGNLVRSTWLRWLCFGFTVNLKPYLVLAVIGGALRRKWRWVESCGIASLLIYLASFALLGKGTPFELISDSLGFAQPPVKTTVDFVEYSTTFNSILEFLKLQFPIMYYIGSRPIEFAELALPWTIRAGTLGVLICFSAALFRPTALTARRTAALGIAMLLTTSRAAGGYAEVFLIFLVFFERPGSVGQGLALLVTYVLCIPWDFMLVRIIHAVVPAYLSGRTVGFDFGVTLGAILRPALLLVVEYGLIAASLTDLMRDARRRKSEAMIAGREPTLLPSAS